jgi:hypothetical protein
MQYKYTCRDCEGRGRLSEGRSEGPSFSFCKRTDNDFEAVHPLSGCKDYLNDVVYTEATKEPTTQYGLTTKYHGLFEKEPFGYLAMSVIAGYGCSLHSGLKNTLDKMMANVARMESCMHFFEEKFDIPERTEIHKTGDNMLVVFVPLWWCRANYRISLYTLVLRNAMYWDGKEDIIKWMGAWKTADRYGIHKIIPKVLQMIDGNMPEPVYPQVATMQKDNDGWVAGRFDPHNYGITYVEFPDPKPKPAALAK